MRRSTKNYWSAAKQVYGKRSEENVPLIDGNKHLTTSQGRASQTQAEDKPTTQCSMVQYLTHYTTTTVATPQKKAKLFVTYFASQSQAPEIPPDRCFPHIPEPTTKFMRIEVTEEEVCTELNSGRSI